MKVHSFPCPSEQPEIDENVDEPGVWEATAAFMISTPVRPDHASFVALLRADNAQCGLFGHSVAMPTDLQRRWEEADEADEAEEADPDPLAGAATPCGDALECQNPAEVPEAIRPTLAEQVAGLIAVPFEPPAGQSAAARPASGPAQQLTPEIRRAAAAESAHGDDSARAASIGTTFGLIDADPQARLKRLRGALRRERARGRCGHWTYDLARHLALAQDVRRAEATLRSMLLAAIPGAAAI